MLFRFRRLRHTSGFLSKIYPDTLYQSCEKDIRVLAALSTGSPISTSTSPYKRIDLPCCLGQRYSTVSAAKQKQRAVVDILSFIRSSLNEPKGPSHYWLNKFADSKNLFKGDGIILVLVGEYVEGLLEATQSTMRMFEKAKALQQRYPALQVCALQYGESISMNDIPSHLLQRIIKDYVTFPLLLTNKNICKMANVPCYIISKGIRNPVVYPGDDEELKVLDKAIHNQVAQNVNGTNDFHDTKCSWFKPRELVKEPDASFASRNLLFAFPGCISVEETGDRLFLSDINHHRIIVFNSSGKILDTIGSSPGFEDGEFENAKLMRPAASFYDASGDCLYFVDSENHAIRRADMEKRVVETVFPVTDGRKNKGLWKWILDKIWKKGDMKFKPEEYNSESFLFPWHLLKSSSNDLYVLNQSFGTLWIIDLESGCTKEIVKESSKIWESCGQMILNKCFPLRQLPTDWLEQQVGSNCAFQGISYAGLMSSVAACQDHVIFCDTVGQGVVKFNRESGLARSFQFSSFGILGLPYWLTSSLERVYAVDDLLDLDHSQCFHLLPGEVNVELNVDIPQHTDLVEQPQEGCIWRQARGAAVEVSGVENKAASSEKVGVAQQWYDEIDHLVFSTPQEETNLVEESKPPGEQVQEGTVRIGCTINTSPGTSEVIIYAAIYLRLKRNTSSHGNSQEEKAAKIADILDPKGRFRKDLLVKLLTMSNRDVEELIFMRPLHVRLRFNNRNHPKAADNSKDIIVSESSVKVHVTL